MLNSRIATKGKNAGSEKQQIVKKKNPGSEKQQIVKTKNAGSVMQQIDAKKKCRERKQKLASTSRVTAFKNSVKEGPYYICVVCNRCLYKKTVKNFDCGMYEAYYANFVYRCEVVLIKMLLHMFDLS